MHELPFAKSIFKTVLAKAQENNAKAVTLVALEVGALRDFVPEIVQKYWVYVTKNSLAEGSCIKMREIPATARCAACQCVYEVDTHHIMEAVCPQCGHDKGYMLTGRELRIVGIEIEPKEEEQQ